MCSVPIVALNHLLTVGRGLNLPCPSSTTDSLVNWRFIGAPISKEDINQKFLRSLPSSWNQIALIMRNKPDIDEIDIDDLYNNLRVYEDELKRSSGSNSASQNLAFLSSENTGSTNEVSTASGDFGVSTAGGINQFPYTLCGYVGNVRVKKFIQRTGRNMDFKEKRPVSLNKSKIECYNCHRKKGILLGIYPVILGFNGTYPLQAHQVLLTVREGKLVWDNTKKVNHQNFSKYPHLSKTFVPSGVLTRTGFVSTARPSISTGRPSINTARPVSTSRPSISIARPVYERPRGSCSPIKRGVVNTGKGKLNTDLKKSRWVWRPKENYLDHVFKDSGSFMLKKGNQRSVYRIMPEWWIVVALALMAISLSFRTMKISMEALWLLE
ncbi:hypothetical protein Tco_0661036 [Tanacetum coccineum]